jgi:methylamine dehydrogenase accessory protein MauD
MNTVLIVSNIALWGVVIAIAFLLLGTLRSLGLLQWQLDQVHATRPSRINREGLKPGRRAPDFTLPRVDGGETSLKEYGGKRVLLVFVQPNCGPCHEVVPALSRLHRSGELEVLAVNKAERDEAAEWAAEVHAEFPVLVQDGLEISKKYQVFATPFAFLIDEQGVIASSGIVNNRQHVRFLLDAAADHAASQKHGAGNGQTAETVDELPPVENAEGERKAASV